MILKLRLGRHKIKEVSDELMQMGVTISEEADLILTEQDYEAGEIYCRDDTDRIVVSFSEILYIESFGKDVLVHTKENTVYKTALRLYELEKRLPAEDFLRISNSAIISRKAIKKARPTLGQKFYLTLKNGDSVDVTRTYYYKFKDYYGI